MNKNITFISGNEYFLRDFFGGDTMVIIPDLQRDYCWGDKAMVPHEKKTRELVSGFVKSLLEQYRNSRDQVQTMGLIYGYEQPRHRLQICDGQQRLTTLFLLLGYINMNTPDGIFNDYLVSGREREDDYEPHLQYSIRESTLYFLSDLTKHVFIEKTTELKDIRKGSEWYFNEYDQDASIQSILAALDHIDEVFTYEVKRNTDVNIVDFGKYILEKLMFLYYDMGTRTLGEETYVVINTTGEPLSATENIKPILLGNLSPEDLHKYSDQWESREEWFWSRRGTDTTADEGMRQFFQWYWQIGLIQEKTTVNGKEYPLNTRELFLKPTKMVNSSSEQQSRLETFRSLENLNKYFVALKTLVSELFSDERSLAVLLSISSAKRGDKRPTSFKSETDVWQWLRGAELHIVLPMVAFLAKHPDSSVLYQFLRRLRRNHFDLEWSRVGNTVTRRAERFVDWRYIVQIINNSSTDDILTVDTSTFGLKKIQNIDSLGSWYGDNERVSDILRQNGHEAEVDEWENNPYLMGDLTPIWNVIGKENANFDSVKPVWLRFESICRPFLEKEPLAKEDRSLFNWFRLYLVVTDMKRCDHIPNMTWEIEGIFYYKLCEHSSWIEDASIRTLLSCSNMIETMKEVIRRKVGEYIFCPSTHTQLLTSWLVVKTIQAEVSGSLVCTCERPIGVFRKMERNYIIPSLETFNWGNVMCGFAYRSGVFPANEKIHWENPSNLDSPLYSLAFIQKYNDAKTRDVKVEEIARGEKEILKLLSEFFGNPAGIDR